MSLELIMTYPGSLDVTLENSKCVFAEQHALLDTFDLDRGGGGSLDWLGVGLVGVIVLLERELFNVVCFDDGLLDALFDGAHEGCQVLVLTLLNH